MKKFDESYEPACGYVSGCVFLDFLVDKVRDEVKNVICFLETGEQDLEKIQDKLDEMTDAINDLQEEFEEHDSELETAARESIGETVDYILHWFGIDIDVEEAIRNRDW